MKKKIAFLLIILVAIAGCLYAVNRMNYTSLNEKALNQITKNDDVRIDIKRYSDDAKVSLTDKDKVEKLLKSLSSVELKKENMTWPSGDYAIRVYVNGVNKLGMEMLTNKNYVWINEQKGGVYKVSNQVDLFKIIEEQHLDWTIPGQ